MKNQTVEGDQGYSQEKQIEEGKGTNIVRTKSKKGKDINEWLGFVDIIAGGLAIAGVVGFVAKYFVAQTHVVTPYVLPTFFLGLQLFFLRPGLETEKLRGQHWYGKAFWSSFFLCIASILFEWIWIFYNMAGKGPSHAMKLNSIADVASVVFLLTQTVLKSWANGLSFRSLGGKFEWCGIIVLWCSAPALQIVNALFRFGDHPSASFGTILLGFVCLGVVLVLVGEHEPQDEDMEGEPLNPDQVAETSAMYKSTQTAEAEATS